MTELQIIILSIIVDAIIIVFVVGTNMVRRFASKPDQRD